jgi:hypothetical protein
MQEKSSGASLISSKIKNCHCQRSFIFNLIKPTMRSIAEIIDDATNTKHTSSSGSIFDICRELSGDGRFEEMAQVLTAWCKQAPHSEYFVKESLPAIVLNTYLVKQDILTFEQFLQWVKITPGWADSIKYHALSEVRLPAAVATVVKAMQQFTHAQSGSPPDAAR